MRVLSSFFDFSILSDFRLPVSIFGTSGFRKLVYFRFEVETGSRTFDDAESGDELYTTPKFHPNPNCSL